jgi:predicted amidohydrolase
MTGPCGRATGEHDDRALRESYGHALIVDPWGEIRADAGERPGFALAEIDLGRVREVRRTLPMSSPAWKEE